MNNKKQILRGTTLAAVISLLAQGASAEVGCPTGFVPDGNEKLADPAFSNGYNSFTTDIPKKFEIGVYPIDGPPNNTTAFPKTAISIIDGDVNLGVVEQTAFPGDPNPGGGLPPVPAVTRWLAYNGVNDGAPSKIWGQTISGLTPNVDYAFTAYFSNALAPGQQAKGAIAPNVAFHLDGVPMGVEAPVCDSGSGLDPVEGDCAVEATADKWQRFGVTINPGNKTSIEVSIHDAVPMKSPFGDDFAMTLVSFQQCVPIGTPDIESLVGGTATTSVSFPDYTPGNAAVTQTVTITNNGTGNLVIGNIGAPDNPDFTVVTDNCSTQSLGAGESCTLELAFSTTTPGNRTGTLLIPSNDPDAAESPLPLTLQATARNVASVAVLGDSGQGEILTRLDGGIGGGGALGLPLALGLIPLALRRRRRLLAATALVGFAATAHAEQGQVYIGGGFGMSQLEPKIVNLPVTLDDDNDKAFKLFLGYDVLDWLSVEGFASTLGAASLSNGDIDYDVYGGSVVANLPANDKGFSVLGKVGYSQINNSSDTVPFREVEGHEIHAGAGVEYQFENGFSLRGEYEYFDKDAKLISLSLVKRFGGEEEPVSPPVVIAVVPEIVEPAPVPPVPKAAPKPKLITLDIEPIHFETASARLRPSTKKKLDHIAALMMTYPNVKVHVIGHTDSRGSIDYNLALSMARAKSVMMYLVDKGIERKRLSFEGRGESDPVADNSTPEGRAQNRRVEFEPKPKMVPEK